MENPAINGADEEIGTPSNAKRRRATNELKEQIIECVRQHRHLYDPEDRKHHNSYACRFSWTAISDELGISPDECKKKWTCLRKQYLEIRRNERIKRADGSSKPVKWAYYDLLSFLDEFDSAEAVLQRNMELKISESYEEMEDFVDDDQEKDDLTPGFDQRQVRIQVIKKQIIESVRQHRHLYDPEDKNHHNSYVCRNAWNAIGNELGLAPEECKRRWTSLRKHYLELRRGKRGSKLGEATTKPVKWAYYDLMSFLNEFKDEKALDSNLISSETAECEASDSNADSQASASASCSSNFQQKFMDARIEQRILRLLELRKQQKQIDECEAFGSLVAASLRELQKRQRAHMMHEIGSVMFKYRLENVTD